jgi:hypothetical protein
MQAYYEDVINPIFETTPSAPHIHIITESGVLDNTQLKELTSQMTNKRTFVLEDQ